MTEHTLGTRPHDDAAAPGHAAAVRGVAARLGLVAPRHSLHHLWWEVPLTLLAQGLVLAASASVLLPEGMPVRDPAGPAYREMPCGVFVLGVVLTVVAVPLLQELVLRRGLLDWLSPRTGVPGAVLISAAATALVHPVPVLMLPAAVGGLACALSYRWHASLCAPWILHAALTAPLAGATLVVLLAP